MSTESEKGTISVAAGADLSGCQYKAIEVAGTVAAANALALGILQNKPQIGEGASIAYAGHMKAYVGGAVTAGVRLKVTTSGWLVVVASGDGAVGKAIKAAGSGALCEIVANFPSAATTY
ncbi:MAG: hypothetical protein A2W25_15200 [candidate division Zixibacteria bacterium RBG_16_53_22]|nr:MAG: hypothetical protein A2W25_15200 [candidate division Zixibacteria bacterium RBG_16_53_22]